MSSSAAPPPSFGAPSAPRAWRGHGGWLLGVVAAVYAVSLAAAHAVASRLGSPPADPAAAAPVFFVRRDVIEGACLLAGVVVSGGLGAAFRARWPLFAWASVWAAMLLHVAGVWRGLVGWVASTDLFGPSPAVPWGSLEHYVKDPVVGFGRLALPAAVIVLAWRTRPLTVRSRRGGSGPA